MKLRKLNARGFSHHFVMALVVLVVAIGGVYYLVASHADDSCSSPTSGVSTVSSSAPASGSTSGVCQLSSARFSATDDQTFGTANNYHTTMTTNVNDVTTGTTQVVFTLNGPAGVVTAGAQTSTPTTGYQYSLSVTNLPNGVYHLSAIDYAPSGNGIVGALDGNSSLTFTVDNSTSTSGAPAAPLDLTATALSSAEIGLSWQPSTGATGYAIYRNGNEIATAGPTAPDSATAFADTGLTPSTTYSYYVIAYNSVGTKGEQSAPSNTATATTKAVTVTPPPTAAEELSIPPQRRPVQYLSLCGVGKTAYVSDNTSNCWAGGSLLENYAPSVPGTYYNVPCVGAAANSVADRFVYIAPGEVCPSGTTAVPLQLSTGEQLSFPPAKRPTSYLTQCTAGNLAYVALNSCVYRVPNSVYEFTYTPPVAGTYYATPCATVIPGGGLRYLYIAAGTSCPAYTFGNLER
jgi:hypothetical protein